MQGWIKFHRKILDNEIWQDPTAFRLFTLLLLQASHKDGVKTRGIPVNRGQYLRSYSKLSEDLGYAEGRGIKNIPKSTVERKVKKLIDLGMVSVSETVSGTLFTVLKYEEYQGFEGQPEEVSGTVSETNAGRSRDEPGTNVGQEQELKNLSTKELITTTATTTPSALPENGFAKALQTFEANLCKLSPLQMQSLGKWFDDFDESYEILEEAIKISADRNKKNFGFFEYLLKEWSDNKLTTLEQVQSHERNKFNNASAKQNAGSYQPRQSYRNKPVREEKLPEWFGQVEPERIPETVPPSKNLEAEKQKLLDRLAARKGANHEGN